MSSLSLDAPDTERQMRLLTKDGGVFEISLEYAKLSQLVCTALESDSQAEELPLDFESGQLTGATLQHIINFLNAKKGQASRDIPEPLPSSVMKDVVDEVDATFIDDLYDTHGIYVLYDVISAANYMSIKSLLQLGCAKVAAIVKNKPIRDLESVLNPEKRQKPSTTSTTTSTTTTPVSTNSNDAMVQDDDGDENECKKQRMC